MGANTSTSQKSSTTVQNNSLDYSKAEPTIQNIVIPNSQFKAKWVKDEGYAIGYENVKLTRSYETLEKALNQIGYGVDKDNDGDEILVKVGEIDYELIMRMIKAVIVINNENVTTEKEAQNG